MMPLKRNISRKLALVIVIVASLGGCGQGADSIVVRVGGGVITSAQLQHWVSLLEATRQGVGKDASHLSVPALEFLVKARVTEAEAREADVTVSDSEAGWQLWNVEYAQARELPPVPFGWEDELKQYLLSPAAGKPDRMWLMRLSLLHTKLEQRRIHRAETMVSREEIKRYYSRHGAMFVVPEERDMAIMESGSLDGMRQARRALIEGMSPEAVAKRFSHSPVDPSGLKFHYRRGRGAPALDAAIFAARPHIVVGPLKVYWYYVFEILAVRPRHRESLAAVGAVIRRRVAESSLSRLLDRQTERKWLLRAVCRPGFVALVCKRDIRAAMQTR
jgi:hypothetical protein